MFTNAVKRKLEAGEIVVGTMVEGLRPTGVLAQLAARAGFDFLMLTMEHSAYSLQDVHDLCQMARAEGIVPLVRVPDLSYQWVAQTLDLGALGVMAPRIQDRRQAAQLVSYVRYPPHGVRGYGGRARTAYGTGASSLREMMASLDRETLVIAQIEDQSAVAEIDEIAALDGIDVCVVGPMDYSIACGTPGDVRSQAVQTGIERIIAACARHGRAAGAHFADPNDLKTWVGQGMRFLMCSNDFSTLQSGWQGLAQALRAIAHPSSP